MASSDLTLVSEASLPAHLSANLNTAKAYADTKKNEAIADATAKVDAAKAAAATDATTKANNAKAEAITAAAIDATAKAEEVRWNHGGLAADSPVNGALGAMKDGETRANSDARAVELGLPFGKAGKFSQISFGTFGFQCYETVLGAAYRLWSETAWGEWVIPHRVYTDAAVAAVKWYQGGLLATAPVNAGQTDLADGIHRVTSGTRAAELGLPHDSAGSLKQVTSGTFGFRTYESLYGTSAQMWSDSSKAWGAWVTPHEVYTDAAVALALAAAKQYTDDSLAGNETLTSGTKLVPLALTLGHGGGAYGVTNGTVRFPMWWGAPISRARVHIRNINPRENQVRTGAVSFPQGIYLGNDLGAGIASDLVQIAEPFSTPENGDEWVSGWFEFDAPANSKHILSAAYDAADTVVNNAGGCWISAGHVANSTAGTWEQKNMAPFDWWIEAETPATVPVVAIVSDSTGAGSGATVPVLDSVLSQHMRAWGGLPIHYAHVGDSFHSYNGGGVAGSETYKKTRWTHLARPDATVIGLGNNDLYGYSQASLETMQGRFAETYAWVTTALSRTVFVSTITPRDLDAGLQDEMRKAYNSWLKEQTAPGGAARGVFDFAAAVSTNDATINPEYNADGIHLNTAGYAAEAAILKNLSSPAVMYAL